MNPFSKLQQIRGIFYGRRRYCLRTPEEVTRVVYLHVTLFEMHKRDTTGEREFDAVL